MYVCMCVCVYVCGPSENNLIAQGLCFFAPPQELIERLQQEPLHNQNKERNVIVHLELGFSSKPLTSQSVAVKKESKINSFWGANLALSTAKSSESWVVFILGQTNEETGAKLILANNHGFVCRGESQSVCIENDRSPFSLFKRIFWERLFFYKPCWNWAELKFSVWGPIAWMQPLNSFFSHMIPILPPRATIPPLLLSQKPGRTFRHIGSHKMLACFAPSR